MSTECPCGLTQEKLDAKGWVDDEQCCRAKYKDANGNVQVCGELYTSHPSASSQQSTASSPKGFVVNVVVKNCANYKGYRSAMYHTAAKCVGYYVTDETTGNECSFVYNENDLRVRIGFKDELKACEFQNMLVELQMNHMVANGIVVIDERIEKIRLDLLGRRIFHSHYDTKESGSPECLSLADLASVDSEVPMSESDPNLIFQSVEKKSVLTPHLSLYKCHIAGKAQYPAYRNDISNILFASWDFHNHLDGLHNDSRKSEIALKFESSSEQQVEITHDDIVYHRFHVVLVLEFRNDTIARWFQGRMKDGSEVISSLECRTYMYVANADNLKQYLELQYKDTKTGWDEDTPIAKKAKVGDNNDV